ncbi:TonB-dependent receptor [Povalibacter uvarum]|uniref:TonB-dependent receptor n=1 Tax=Povalibacter uvarum TaxID=732238 RepID=A0A841HRC6_9GAMM|nr:TonB-dependent receptor [Povalibacter uvarum]MBB6094869.1 TonB-dependent receptor [Povalibacter uvarum]
MGVGISSIGVAERSVATDVRRALRGGLSLTVGTCLLVASAQSSAQAKDGLEEVIVTGIRQSLESAQQIKQEAEQIVDSVTAQDIGALPDRSVSEALQRIPGITLQRTNENRDPARLASEGGGVFIRGLSWVRSETNGRDVFSANNGRGLSFEDVSADLLSGINVYKNPSADMIEGGIGGTVDLRTRMPFDSSQQIIAVSADYNYADLLEDGFFSGNALFSDSWDTGIGRIGALFSYSIGNIGNRTDSIQTGRYEAQQIGGQERYIPNSIGWRRIDWEQERTAANVALQWQPNDETVISFQALQAEAEPTDIEYAMGDYNPPSFDPARSVYNDQGVLIGGVVPSAHVMTDSRYTEQHKKTSDYSVNVKYTPNDNWAMSADLQYVKSTADILSMTAYTGANNTTGTIDFDLSGDTPYMQWNDPLQSEKANYWWAAAMDHLEDNEADEVAVRADVEYTFDDNPFLKSFRVGVRATDKDATTRQTGWNWGLLSQQFWGPNPANDPNIVLITEPGFGSNTNPGLLDATQLVNFNNFFRGDVNMPGVGWLPTKALVGHGNQNAYNLLRNTQSSFWGWTPLSDQSYSTARPGGDNVTGGVNDQGETTQAAYAVIRFGQDDSFVGRFDGNFGVRVVKTESTAAGLAMTVTPLQGGDPAGCAASTLPGKDCAAFNAAYAFANGGATLPPVDESNTYTDVLPTLNLRFFLTDDVQLRFAAGKAIYRPSFSQMVPYTSLSFTFTDNYVPNSQGWATATGGNPQLEPTKSTQFDTSLEWYFAPGGSVTGALFYKEIKDYIFIGNEEEEYTSGGETISFLTSRNMNGSEGKVKGFEIAYQQFYDMLPGWLGGFGLLANYTFVDSSGGKNTAVNILESPQVIGAADQELPLEGMSENSYNVALMYEKYGISARLAYNWREEYLLTTSAANIQRPVWMEDYGQLDASVFYSLTKSIKVGVQGTNLMNSRTYLDVGGSDLHPRYSWTDTDRRIAFAVRASF